MTVGVRHDDLRRRNRAMVVGAVRRATQPSRTEIAATTRLSNSTISAISSDLIAEGALVEVKSGEAALARRGRPQVALGLDPVFASVVSVVLTLNQLWTSLISYDGTVADEAVQRLPTMTMGKDELAEAVVEAVRCLLQRGPRRRRPRSAPAHSCRHRPRCSRGGRSGRARRAARGSCGRTRRPTNGCR